MVRWLCVLWLLLTATVCQAAPALLGVLEQPQCGEAAGMSARVMFVTTPTGWRALRATDHDLLGQVAQQRWSVVLDGGLLGETRLGDPHPIDLGTGGRASFRRDRLFAPVGSVPMRANTTGAFSGWCKPPTQRPLPIMSAGHRPSGAVWRPVAAPRDILRNLYPALRLVLGRTRVSRCRAGAKADQSEPFAFTAGDMKVYGAYRSRSGDHLVAVGLNPERYGCDGPAEAVWSPQWFLLRQGSTDYLGSQMTFVDAGDYANDGHTELLFWKSGYNEDGYVLFYDDLRGEARYTWKYH